MPHLFLEPRLVLRWIARARLGTLLCGGSTCPGCGRQNHAHQKGIQNLPSMHSHVSSSASASQCKGPIQLSSLLDAEYTLSDCLFEPVSINLARIAWAVLGIRYPKRMWRAKCGS